MKAKGGGSAHWGILWGHGGEGLVFVTILLLKCICLVFHGENGQNEIYSDFHLQTLYELVSASIDLK